MSLKPYPQYKDSGLQWLGEIPAHWDCVPLRRVARVQLSNVDKHTLDGEIAVRLCNYTDVYYRNFINSEINFMEASALPREVKKFELKKGDVLITKDSESWTDIAVPAFVDSDLPGVLCGYHLAQIRPSMDEMSGEYIFRSFQAEPIAHQFRIAANGVTRFGLSGPDISAACLPIPTLAEQTAITAFLRYFDRRINRLIRAKRRHNELLNEQKQAIIHQAVTRGLDPNVRLRPSGIDWLGDVPEHWEVKRLKQISVVHTGITIGKNYGDIALIERPYLRVANVQAGFLDLSHVTTVRVPHSEAGKSTLEPGDVLMTEGGDIDKLGRGCAWQGEIAGCLHQNHIFAVRVNRALLIPDFLVALMGSPHGRSFFQVTAKQTTHLASTNSTTLGNFPLHLPGVDEQQSIVNHIAGQCSAQEIGIDRARRGIDLFREYRTRLIADVVTGKLDVRGVELPGLDDDDELKYLDVEETSGLDGPDESSEDPDDDE